MKFSTGLLAFVVLCASHPRSANGAAVMSIDFGSEWMKVGVVSPGVPMEMALNKESKRKTPAVVAFRDGERTFGEDAFTIGVRFPKNSYAHLLDLLGKTMDNPLVQRYMKLFPHYDISADPDRGTPVFHHDEKTKFTPEELVAQLLSKAREFAQTSTGQIITECIITVPGFFNQAERSAMLEAARLADIRVLQLINDHAAIALNYGIFRRKEINESAQYVVFYDMGAHSTKVSVVEYKIVKTKERGFVETNPQLQVLGVGYDRTLGGSELTLRLRDHLAVKFNTLKKTPNDVTKNPRSMAKLLKEANRVKVVLSANADHYAQVEGLIDDHDFRVQVTREDLEEMCKDLLERVPDPLTAALKNAGLTLDVVNQVILVGAATRMPKVQEILQEAVGSDLGKNINADEAAALGAVYRAADLSVGFKVKKFIIKDAVLFPVQVLFERDNDGQVRQVKRTLFGLMNPYPQKKVITFNKHSSDFSFYVNYAELEHLSAEELRNVGSLNLSRVDLTGVADALVKNRGANIEPKGIKAHFAVDDSGLLRLAGVESVAEKTLAPGEEEEEESSFAKLGSTISKLFGSDATNKEKPRPDKESQEMPTEERSDAPSAEKNDTSTEKSKENSTEPEEAEPAKPKIIILKETIDTSESVLSVPVMTDDQFAASFDKIAALNKFDAERTMRETALNNLEAFVIDARSKMDTKEYSSCGTDDEIEAVRSACSEVSDWLYEDGSDADVGQYERRLKELKKKTDGIYGRHWEHKERPDALAALKSLLNASRSFLHSAKNLTKDANPDRDVFTDVEITVLTETIEGTEKWMKDAVAEQKKLKKSEEVKLTVKSITEKLGELDREVKYLVNKMKMWKPKKPPAAKEEKTTESAEAAKENVIDAPPAAEASGEAVADESNPQDVSAQDETTPPETFDSSGDVHNEL